MYGMDGWLDVDQVEREVLEIQSSEIKSSFGKYRRSSLKAPPTYSPARE